MDKSLRINKVNIGLFILLLFIFISIFAPVLSPYSPNKMGTPYMSPSNEHLLGTNDIGQDILSELIYGSRISLLIGIISALVITTVGTIIGIIAGYYGGNIDRILMSITSLAMTIPMLPLTIILVAYLGANIWNIIIAICITAWPSTARIIRSRVMQIRELPYIKIEKTMGVSDIAIMFVHIVPNIIDIIFIRGITSVAGAMLTEASLSFLGLGVIGVKSWGGILHYAFFRNGIINGYYWWYMPPIICISLSVLGFMLLSYYKKESRD